MTREQVLDRILNPPGPPLDPAEEQEFERWLNEEPELRAMFEQQTELFAVMDGWETPEPSAGFDREVYARIERDAEQRRWWNRLWFASWKPAMAAGLGAAAALIGVLLLDQPPAEAPQVAVKTAADAEYYEEMERALDDLEMLVDFEAFPQTDAPGRS